MLPTANTHPSLLDSAIPVEYVQLGEAVAAAYLESGCTWSLNTLAMRIAGAIKVAADKAAARREEEVREELEPRRCLECRDELPADADDGSEFCSFSCERSYVADVRGDQLHEDAIEREMAREVTA